MADAILGYLQQAGFKGEALKTAWAIAKRESGFNPAAFNGNAGTGDRSWGLFQINTRGPLVARVKQYGLKSEHDLLDPLTNAKVAYKMSKGGTDFGAWGVGRNAYRQMPALSFEGYPGGGPDRQLAVRTAKPTPTMTLKDLNALARSFGFKSFAKAYGLDDKHAKALLKVAFPVAAPHPDNPTRVLFQAKPSGKGSGGVAELFYDPAGPGKQWNEGSWTNPIGGHSDHVHVSFSDPQAAFKIIQLAQDMGLRVGENPYVGSVAPGVHTDTSFHYRVFPDKVNGKTMGEAIDVSGTANLMMNFFTTVRRFIA
jgi:hypothetical protein